MRIGIITGSGTYALPSFEDARPAEVATEFGTALLTEGRFAGADVLHVSRHGEGHRRLSNQVAHQANIPRFRRPGADAFRAVTASGPADPTCPSASLGAS